MDHGGLIEERSLRIRRRLEDRPQQLALATADVGDRSIAREVVGLQDGRDIPSSVRDHGLVEDSGQIRIGLEPCPHPPGANASTAAWLVSKERSNALRSGQCNRITRM